MLATLKNQESLFNLKNVFSFMLIIPVECEYEKLFILCYYFLWNVKFP